MIHNCVANNFFCILFSFKKMTPPWQFYLDHCDKYYIINNHPSLPPYFLNMNIPQF